MVTKGKSDYILVPISVFLDEQMSRNTILVVACSDPEALWSAFHQGSVFILNVYCQAGTNLVDRDCGLSKQAFINQGFL